MVENILFDLGGVILSLDLNKTLKEFAALGWPGLETGNITEGNTRLFASLETGKNDPCQFRENIRHHLGSAPSDDEIDHAWNAMLLGFDPAIIDRLVELKRRYRLFLLSNTNAIHQNYFRQIFQSNFGMPFDDLFDATFYSHEIGFRKPDQQAFLEVIKATEIKQESTLFIDDSFVNTQVAATMGFEVLHILPGTLLDALPNYLK